ncbi:MAG: hypothetical protein ABI045_00640 [Flavobacteriales bacterium]
MKDSSWWDQEGITVNHDHVEENFLLISEHFKEHIATLKDSPADIYQREGLSTLKSQMRIELKLSGYI